MAGAVAGQASAAFPGRDGLLSWAWSAGGKYEFPWSYLSARSRHARFSHRLSTCGGLQTKCFLPDGAAFSPDGSRFAFQRSWHDGSGARVGNQLVVMAVDGGSASYVPAGRFVDPPAWSPDGTSLAVAGIVAPGPIGGGRPETDLLEIGLDGDVVERLTFGGASDPDWAVDGTIAFVRGGQIWLMRRGGDMRQLTWRGGSAPSWAPDARRLAFERDGQIWSVRVDGRSPRRLTRRGGISPAWSPDGRRIAFIRPGGEVQGLWTMRTDGRAPRFTGEEGGPAGYSSIADPAWQARPLR